MDSLLAEQFQVIPVAARVLLLAQEVKFYEKAVKLYRKIFVFKVF